MSLATVQFYRNQYRYPHYSESLISYGNPMTCTPTGINLRSGTIKVQGDMTDFMSCNYLSLNRDNQTIFAWIDDVSFHTANSFEISYSVDAWRTYKNKVHLGTQFIARRPEPTKLKDKLLGGSTDYPDIVTTEGTIGVPVWRTLVVQCRPAAGEPFSRSPVQPTPYQFFFYTYELNNWTADTTLQQLMTKLADGAQTENIVTIYSIPYVEIDSLETMDLPIRTPSGTTTIPGFKFLSESVDPSTILWNEAPIQWGFTDVDALLRVDHSVQLVIPEAGIIDIPDNLLDRDDLMLRQDIDLFSGACNYMLKTNDGTYIQSVRGSSVSSIPILSDPLDTYLSQNQNALATSLIGDVASIAGGAAAAIGTGGLGAAVGGGLAASGVNNIINRTAQHADIANKFSNPPAFLGTALAHKYNGRFWVVTQRTGVENDVQVHANFGYPVNLISSLQFPTSGFIQTEGCNVYSTDGSIPRWALDEINANFNNGILVH